MCACLRSTLLLVPSPECPSCDLVLARLRRILQGVPADQVHLAVVTPGDSQAQLSRRLAQDRGLREGEALHAPRGRRLIEYAPDGQPHGARLDSFAPEFQESSVAAQPLVMLLDG